MSSQSFLHVSIAATALAACLSPEDAALPDPVRVVGVQPSTDVPADATVSVVFSGPVRLQVARWPVTVVRRDGRIAPAAIALDSEGDAIRVSPNETWPVGEALSIEIDEGLVDDHDRALVFDREEGISFTTAAPSPPKAGITVRSPPPGRPAPINLRWLTVALVPPIDVGQIVLESPGHVIGAVVRKTSPQGILRAELPAGHGRCAPLCPSSTYRVWAGNRVLNSGDLASITTGTVSDHVAPRPELAETHVTGDAFVLRVVAGEPILVRGTATSALSLPIALEGPLVPDDAPVLESEPAVSPRTRYAVSVEGSDIAGNEFAPMRFTMEAPARIGASISEVVATPLHDWNDSEPNGQPYDGAPGGGAVTTSDEWIEIVNRSAEAIDLTAAGLVLRVLDATPSETYLAHAPFLGFGDGGSAAAWGPGEALVVRARGAISQTDVAVELWSGRRLIDRVAFGSDLDAEHTGGRPPDLFHESLARDVHGRLRWCVPTPGDPLPPADCL